MAQGWKSNVVLSPAAHIAFLRALAAQEDALAQAPSQTGFSSRPLPAHIRREMRHAPCATLPAPRSLRHAPAHIRRELRHVLH